MPMREHLHDRELQFTGHSRIYSRCIKMITSNVSAINSNGKRLFLVYLDAEGSKKYSSSVSSRYQHLEGKTCQTWWSKPWAQRQKQSRKWAVGNSPFHALLFDTFSLTEPTNSLSIFTVTCHSRVLFQIAYHIFKISSLKLGNTKSRYLYVCKTIMPW